MSLKSTTKKQNKIFVWLKIVAVLIPTQSIKPVSLIPIPAADETSSKVVVNCIGHLPRNVHGKEYLLVIL